MIVKAKLITVCLHYCKFLPPGGHVCHPCALSHVTYCHLVACTGSTFSLMYYLGLVGSF